MFSHPKPTKPQIVRDLDAIHRTFNRGLRAADTGHVVDGLLLATRALLGQHELAQALTAEEREQVAAYNREVDAYNRKVDAYNADLRERRAKAQAARETAKVRSARCDRCFTLHSAGQMECW